MHKIYQDNKRYIDKLLVAAGFFVFAYIFLGYILRFISPFVVGFLISVIISPVVGFVQRKLKIARGVSTILLIIIVILLIAVAATSIINRIIIEGRQLTETLPIQLEELRDFLFEVEGQFDRYMTILPEEFAIDFNELFNQLLAMATAALGEFARTASVGLVTGIPLILMNIFLVIISAFFFAKDKKLIADSIMKNLPEWIKTRLRTVQKGLLSAVGGYIRAQLIIMSVVASISILGLTILRYPYAVIMGLVLALFDSLPMIGVSLVLWPWALVSLISGNYTYAVGLLVINAACFMARQLLEPKVLGQQIGIHPLLVLIGVYIGLRVFGLIGLFLGPALLVIAKLILQTSAAAKAGDRALEISPDPPLIDKDG